LEAYLTVGFFIYVIAYANRASRKSAGRSSVPLRHTAL